MKSSEMDKQNKCNGWKEEQNWNNIIKANCNNG